MNSPTRAASAATNSPALTVLDMESLHTESTEAEAARTPKPILCGPVADTIPATERQITPARNSRLSEDEQRKLAKIRRNRQQGWMPTFEEFDFLLEMVERMMSQC